MNGYEEMYLLAEKRMDWGEAANEGPKEGEKTAKNANKPLKRIKWPSSRSGPQECQEPASDRIPGALKGQPCENRKATKRHQADISHRIALKPIKAARMP